MFVCCQAEVSAAI